jgi:hypothetical protein
MYKSITSQHAQLIVLALLLILLGSSCKSECGEPDVDAINGIYLQFNMDGSSNAFTAADLDSVYIVRYGDLVRDSFDFPVDTLNLFLEESFGDDGRLIINKDKPDFDGSGPPYFTDFQYLMRSYGQTWQVRLQDIHLEGMYTDDEQCDYVNLSKTYWLNDDSVDVTASTAYILMNKD